MPVSPKFTIPVAVAKKMYEFQNGFVPTDPATIKGYTEMINKHPEEWASIYKYTTGKEMPVNPKPVGPPNKLAAKAKALKGPIDGPAQKLNKDFVVDYLKYVKGEKMPLNIEIEATIKEFTKNSNKFKVAVQQLNAAKNTAALGPAKKPPAAKAAKGGVAPPAKGPTLNAQIKALLPPKGTPVTVPYDGDDLDQATVLGSIKAELKKKFKNTWNDKYSSARNNIYSCAAKAPDALAFLNAALKIINPNATVYTGAPGQKLKPGEWHGLPTPNIPLSPAAQALAPTPENQAKADALSAKIAAYEAEIKRLKDEREKAEKARQKAEKDKDKLGGIDEKLLKYFTYIEKNCSEAVAAVKQTGQFLYRGQDDASLPVFVGYPRADREPKDSDEKAQKLCDKWLGMMGFKALRGNSIFTSPNRDQASGYGDLYAIFPKNGFQFTWSTEHDDLVMHSESEVRGNDDDDGEDTYYEYSDFYDETYWYEDPEETVSDAYKLEYDNPADIKTGKAITKELKASPEFKALKKAVAAWEKLDSYDDKAEKIHKTFLMFADAAPAFIAKFPKIAKWVDLSNSTTLAKYAAKAKAAIAPAKGGAGAGEKLKAADFVKRFGFRQDNFPMALKNHGEIIILGEYVAVDWEKYEEELKKFFRDSKGKAKVPAKGKPKKVSDEDDEDDDSDEDGSYGFGY